jgi:isopenicillin N synthase-like dioxygenase
MVALRCLSYPATDEAPLADQKGVHADYGSITMQSDPEHPDLEVHVGEWISAPLVPNGLPLTSSAALEQ